MRLYLITLLVCGIALDTLLALGLHRRVAEGLPCNSSEITRLTPKFPLDESWVIASDLERAIYWVAPRGQIWVCQDTNTWFRVKSTKDSFEAFEGLGLGNLGNLGNLGKEN